MDNIGEILFFILIFILSGLSSYFENKKKRNAKKTHKAKDKPARREKAKDILEEILGYKTETPKQTYTPPVDENKEQTWNPENDFKEKESNKVQVTETTEFVNPEIFEKELEHKAEKDFSSSAYMQFADEKTEHYREKLISKMKNPETLREIILFSEIFGKPKALRR